MKKLLSILLCCILVASCCLLFVGCSNNKGKATLYSDNLVQEVENKGDIYTVTLKGKQRVDTMILEEKTDNVTSFGVYGKEDDGSYTLIYKQNRIDKYRVCSLDEIVTDELRIEIYNKQGNVKINNIEAYDSEAVKRETPFRVVDYILSTDQKLQNNQNKKDFYNHFKVVDDLLLFGDISMGTDANVIYNEGKEDFVSDIETINLLKGETKANNPDMKIVVNVDIRSKSVSSDEKKPNKAVYKWIKANMNTIVSNLVAFANEHNVDGLNLDWNYPENGTQWNWFSKLIVELDKQLDGAGKYVTVSLTPNSCSLSKKARNAIEYVNLQTYDMFDERGEHSSNYETCIHSVQTFMQKSKFTADKIMLGLPFYGRTTNQSTIIVGYEAYYEKNTNSINKWINKRENYNYVGDDGIEKYSYLYYNGYAMIRDKTTYAIASGLGGVSVFKFDFDIGEDKELSLHNAIKDAISRGVKVTQ